MDLGPIGGAGEITEQCDLLGSHPVNVLAHLRDGKNISVS